MKSNRTVRKDQYYKKVIDLYTKEHLSMWQIAKIIPIDRSTIWRWISTFAAYGQMLFRVKINNLFVILILSNCTIALHC